VDYAIGGALANDPDAVRRRMVEFLDPTGEDLAEWDATIERFKQKRKRRSKPTKRLPSVELARPSSAVLR
jgi:hypothetical protein